MYEEALGYRPCDPEINEKAARLALELGELDAAREYAETACELSPTTAARPPPAREGPAPLGAARQGERQH